MGKWRDEPMHTGGVMNAGQAPYQKAANDECRICGGTRAILSFFFFLLSRMDRKFIFTR
jgi:ribosomal protein S14